MNIEYMSNKTVLKKELFISSRQGVLKNILDDLKFNNASEDAPVLAEILGQAFLDAYEGIDNENFVIVPVPTVKSHIRARGYDHITLLSESFSYKTNIKTNNLLIRLNKDSQRGADAKKRKEQVQGAFDLSSPVDPTKTYLLFDDIKTTGASLGSAAKALFEGGATEIWFVYILRQVNF